MSIDAVRAALLWCAAINYAVLLLWFFVLVGLRESLYRLWGRWFRLSGEQFDALNFGGIALYKVGVLLFNLVPYIALRIVA